MPGRRPFAALVLIFLLSLPALTTRLYASDEIQFFAWLHSVAFDGDVDFTNEYQHFYNTTPSVHTALFHETFLERRNEAGRPPNFAPIGCALLWAPFYAGGHLAAKIIGEPLDGYSRPYIVSVTVGSAFYGLLAVALSAAIALQVIGRGRGSAAAVWIGTPLLFYMYVAPGFSHTCSAFAVSWFLWLWLRARDRWSVGDACLLGAAGAVMAMVREQDVFFIAGPLLDALRSRLASSGGPRRIRPVAALAGAGGFILGYVPQALAYWSLNGHPSPTDMVARKMTWTSPHFVDVLFSPEHGLFAWTPLAAVALLGLAWLAVRPSASTAAVQKADVRWIAVLGIVMVVLQAYVSGAVESWSVAGSFGQRRFVAITPLLVLGLAALFDATDRRAWRAAIGAVTVLAIWWNIGLMAQFGLHVMDRQRLTLAANARWTFVVLPREVPSLVWRYMTNRSSFYDLPAR